MTVSPDRLLVFDLLKPIAYWTKLAASDNHPLVTDNMEFYRQVFELAAEAQLILQDGSIVASNPAAAELFRAQSQPLLGKAFLELASPARPYGEEPQKVVEEHLAHALSGERQRFDTFLRRLDGALFRATLTISPLLDQKLLVCVQDHSPYGPNTSWFDRFFALSPDMLGLADTQARFLKLNASWERVLGYTKEELLAIAYLDLVHPDDVERTIAEGSRLAAGGECQYFENRYRHKDGSYRWIQWTSVGFPEDQLIAFTARDVTYDRENERALVEAKERLRSIMDSAPVMILAIDREARITSINRTFNGRPIEEIAGLSLYSYFSPEQREVFDEHFKNVLETGALVAYDEHLVAPHVNIDKWLRNQMGPLRKDGEIVGATCILTDITEQHKLEEEVRASHERIWAYAEEMQVKNKLLEEEVTERAQSEEALRAQQEMMRAMATPIIRVWQGVLALPVIGLVDAERAAQMMDMLLQHILESRARFAIMDLTGVERVDAETAMHLSNIVGAARLLGSQVVLSGISPQIAQTMVQHHLTTESYRTFAKLEDALRHALTELGLRVRVDKA